MNFWKEFSDYRRNKLVQMIIYSHQVIWDDIQSFCLETIHTHWPTVQVQTEIRDSEICKYTIISTHSLGVYVLKSSIPYYVCFNEISEY